MNIRKHFGAAATAVAALLIAIFASFGFAGAKHDKSTFVQFYELRERTLDQRGTQKDVERLLTLFAEGAKFEHPTYGVTMNVEQARTGLLAHLGEGIDARYHIDSARIDEDFALVESTLTYVVDGKHVTRRSAAIFEFGGGKILRLAEY